MLGGHTCRCRSGSGSAVRASPDSSAVSSSAAGGLHSGIVEMPQPCSIQGMLRDAAASAPACSLGSLTMMSGRHQSTTFSVRCKVRAVRRPHARPAISCRSTALFAGATGLPFRSLIIISAKLSDSAVGTAGSPASVMTPVKFTGEATRTSWPAVRSACASGTIGKKWPWSGTVVKSARTNCSSRVQADRKKGYAVRAGSRSPVPGPPA